MIRGFLNGEPGGSNVPSSAREYIACSRPTRGSETSQYPKERKSNETSPGSGERPGKSPNPEEILPGVAGYANRHRSSEGKEAGKLCQSG